MNKTGLVLGIIITILLGSFLQNKFCCNADAAIAEKPAVSTTAKATSAGMLLKSATLDYQCDKNFNFNENDFPFISPIDPCVDKGIEALKADWQKNPSQKLLITGYCNANEKNTSAFPNLGFARANKVKEYLISKGLPSDKLEINGIINDTKADKGIVYGPITYELSTVDDKAPKEDWAKLKAEINATPLTVYFETNQSHLNLSPEEREKVTKIVRYLDNVKDAKLAIIGHTDNVGSRDINIKLSKGRADFVAEYFTKNGVSAERMATSSKGPDEPIADNATAEGKAKNRRTVVTLE